ncbi:hypothetical protein ONS95_007904 [Cadophora gregata]|uniref:uncharacterized protein n=1 Tax=Cadophora gregata TaxID=51156 RepID=UPI0026DC2352|nr:uncharacterized protein ONS95_007904 [Cadophora gregata]KAK0119040.1 hypothetical protein ONS96_012108 [Cadophora gregata f. sp. sojae]KAK0126293.1 hypothetical protein ONS95_007904 [Cadophora gregata]
MGSLNDLDTGILPYWQVNVPSNEREVDCPLFLQNLKPKEHAIIGTPDNDYHILTWGEVRQAIAINALDAFQRIPSDLRRYLAYNHYLKEKYGSVMNFVLRERLDWTEPIVPDAKLFEKESDLKILWNDWPYGIDAKIVHLVVWTKFELEDDPKTDDLTDESRAMIEEFVERTFRDVVGAENVIWFKNWRSLKSIGTVEHFHVMLYDPDPDFVRKITNGDVPLSQKI